MDEEITNEQWLRDQFAAGAMEAWISEDPGDITDPGKRQAIALMSYNMAEDMMAERRKRIDKENASD